MLETRNGWGHHWQRIWNLQLAGGREVVKVCSEKVKLLHLGRILCTSRLCEADLELRWHAVALLSVDLFVSGQYGRQRREAKEQRRRFQKAQHAGRQGGPY